MVIGESKTETSKATFLSFVQHTISKILLRMLHVLKDGETQLVLT